MNIYIEDKKKYVKELLAYIQNPLFDDYGNINTFSNYCYVHIPFNYNELIVYPGRTKIKNDADLSTYFSNFIKNNDFMKIYDPNIINYVLIKYTEEINKFNEALL